jgi:hypothetical protein
MNDDDTDDDSVKGTQATGHWPPEEDAKLNSAVTNTFFKKCDMWYEFMIHWTAAAELAPDRTKSQCHS